MKSILKMPCVGLGGLAAGTRGVLCGHAEGGIPARLRDIGFIPGTPLKVLRTAPLGDPIEVELRGYRLCLRRADVAGVCITPELADR